MRQYRNVATAALAVAFGYASMAVLAGGEQRSAGATSPAATTSAAGGSTIEPASEWTDGMQHLVVTTVNGATPVAAEPARTWEHGPSRAPHPSGSTTPEPVATVTVLRDDGTAAPASYAPGSFVATAAANIEEAGALAAAPMGSLIVVDVAGAVGEPGARYLLSGSTLTALGPTIAVAPAGADPATAPDTAGATGTADEVEPTTVAPADVEIVAAVAVIDGVREVVAVGPGVLAVTADPETDVRAELLAITGVLSVDADLIFFTSDDARQGEQWALRNTGAGSQAGGYRGVVDADTAAPAAWTVATGAGVTVAVIDTGVDTNQPDLASRIWTNDADPCGNGVDDDGNGYVDDCRGWDFGTSDNDPNPNLAYAGQEHGTHVAGIAAAARNDVGIVGIAPDAEIMALKTANSSGQLVTSGIIAAIRYATANGADVINLSLGTGPGTPRSAVASMEAAINDAVAAGVVVVAAAGNHGIDTTSNTVWPAGFSVYNPGVITVGASTNSDTKASFSNTGAAVNILAPGSFIMSTLANGGYGFMSGTSMASPYVAGAAAVVLSSNQATTPAEVRERLVATAATAAAGKRLDVARAVGTARGAETGTDVAVWFTGAATLRPDTAGQLGVHVRAGASVDASQIRMSVATREGTTIAAVDGLVADFEDSSGALASATTGATGAFPPLPIRNAGALRDAGTAIDAATTLPAGDYAFVVELLSPAGNTVGGAQVAYFSVSNPPPPSSSPPSSAPPSSAPAPGTTAPSSPSPTVPGTSTPAAPVTTAPPAPVTTAPTGRPPVTSAPGTPPGTSPGAPAPTWPASPITTVPRTPASPSTTVAIGGPVTSPAPTSSAPVNPPPPPPTTVPAPSPPVTSSPAPRPTTPPPPPDSDGAYQVTSMRPRLADLCGTTWLSIEGTFPTTVPVYVWFGDRGPVVAAPSSGSTLTLRSPPSSTARTTDVSVRFTTDRSYTLTLVDAFTFYDGGSCTGGPATTAPANAAPTTSNPASGGPTPVPTSPAPGTTSPTGTAPRPPATTPTTAPATAPPTTSNVVATRGALTLRRVPSAGALASLSAARWPAAGCRLDSCAAARP